MKEANAQASTNTGVMLFFQSIPVAEPLERPSLLLDLSRSLFPAPASDNKLLFVREVSVSVSLVGSVAVSLSVNMLPSWTDRDALLIQCVWTAKPPLTANDAPSRKCAWRFPAFTAIAVPFLDMDTWDSCFKTVCHLPLAPTGSSQKQARHKRGDDSNILNHQDCRQHCANCQMKHFPSTHSLHHTFDTMLSSQQTPPAAVHLWTSSGTPGLTTQLPSPD